MSTVRRCGRNTVEITSARAITAGLVSRASDVGNVNRGDGFGVGVGELAEAGAGERRDVAVVVARRVDGAEEHELPVGEPVQRRVDVHEDSSRSRIGTKSSTTRRTSAIAAASSASSVAAGSSSTRSISICVHASTSGDSSADLRPGR